MIWSWSRPRDLHRIGGYLVVKETILAVLSDMHTGSSVALFPRKGFVNSEGNLVSPNDKQRAIYPIWVRFTAEVAKDRRDKRLIVVMLGDAVDGFHHGSLQESLFKATDQCEAHLELMTEFLKKVNFHKGDELYYVRGTEAHVGETENDMAKELRAIPNEYGRYVHETLTLNVNGRRIAFYHHGKARGLGDNEGNSLRNYLKNVRSERRKAGVERLDAMYSGHAHGHAFETHRERQPDGNYHSFHGVICPSWQAKTVYALGKVPMLVNSVGGTRMIIDAAGRMQDPYFTVLTTRDG